MYLALVYDPGCDCPSQAQVGALLDHRESTTLAHVLVAPCSPCALRCSKSVPCTCISRSSWPCQCAEQVLGVMVFGICGTAPPLGWLVKAGSALGKLYRVPVVTDGWVTIQ